MQVSVITPIFNAAPFVAQSVESALAQPETAEVLLIEDGSTDGSPAVCRELAARHPRVRLLRHADGGNHGYPASLNLGIRESRCEWIAFLDADDFYLPERFGTAREVIVADRTIEGVYEAIRLQFDDEAARRRWEAAGQASDDLVTIRTRVAPEDFFDRYMSNDIGFFHTNGLTVHRSVFEKTGLFDEHLLLHQDSAMNIKLAAAARLAPGELERPVAVMRVHGGNRTSAPRSLDRTYRNKMRCWDTAWAWSREHLEPEKEQVVLEFLLRQVVDLPRFNR
ncbi:MAG TPA: glycosyltransferase, partial [Anaerolineales bacterium]|nr:glycosyltransferase [Anaerolineales bacterium]